MSMTLTHIDDNTKITTDNSSKAITNYAVHSLDEGFELWLFHALKITGSHVDEAEIVATWHFDSLEHLEQVKDKIVGSVKSQSNNTNV